MFEVNIGSDGGKNCHITITGELSANLLTPEPVLWFRRLNGSPTALRLDGLQFAVQEKMGFNLWWIVDLDFKPPRVRLIMPVESRGGFDFEKIKPISSPPDAVGIALTSFKVTEKNMTFMLMLDLTKQ